MEQNIQNRKKQVIIQTLDACSNMIVGVRQLKLSVLDLFSTLADNGPDPQRNQQVYQERDLSICGNNKLYHQQALSNLATSHSLCTSAAAPLRIQKQQEQQQHVDLLQYVNEMISSITATIRSLDQDIVVLMQHTNNNAQTITLGESVHLGMDCSLERHNLYMELCQSYKNSTNLHNYSTHCHTLLHQQSLKRVHKKSDNTNPQGSNIQNSRDSHAVVATFNPYSNRVCLSRSSVMHVLETVMKQCEYMEGSYSQPFGMSTGVFQISVNRVLKAILVMRGIVIDAVIVKAYHESFASKANKPGSSYSLLAEVGGSPFVDPEEDIDLWSESKYSVFRRLTHHANAAVLHFQYPTYPEIAVRSFLAWFNSYSDLFMATCSRCNTRLRKFMPPICREFSGSLQPHHDSCK